MNRPSMDLYFMRMASVAASRATCPRKSVGAVIVRDRRVLSTGYNGSIAGQPHCTEVGCMMVDNQRAASSRSSDCQAVVQLGPSGHGDFRSNPSEVLRSFDLGRFDTKSARR